MKPVSTKTAVANEVAAEAKKECKETLLESISGIALLLVVYMFVITFVAQNFEIPSPSMVPTLLIGDHVLMDHAAFAPPAKWMPLIPYRAIQHGDVVVFLKPTLEGMILVKRAIGLPGDRIHLRHGILYRNGVAQKEPQISVPDDSDPAHTYEPFRDDFPSGPADALMTATWANEWQSHVVNGELVVPDDMILGLGDNRVGSLDSRFWGFIPRKAVLGRPLFVYWSFMTPEDQQYKTNAGERVAFFTHVVIHFFDQTRWKRTFHRIV